MSTIPSSYPQYVVSFPTVTDQPITPNDIDSAVYTNEIYAELVAMETTLGTTPYFGLPYQTLNKALLDLLLNKAPGHAVNGIVTTTLGGHSHHHSSTVHSQATNEHPRYIHVNGVNTITSPLTAPQAVNLNQLVTLDQYQSMGFITSITGQLNTALVGTMKAGTNVSPRTYTVVPWDARGSTLWGIAGIMYGDSTLWPIIYNANRALIGSNPNLIFTGMVLTIPDLYQNNVGQVVCGGYVSGVTDDSGNIFVGFGGAFSSNVQSFVIIRMPGPGGLSRVPYNYLEDLLLPRSWNTAGAIVQYVDDAFINKERAVAFSFIAIGN